jgi:hypothetical protein
MATDAPADAVREPTRSSREGRLQGRYESEPIDQARASAKQQALETLQSNRQIEELGARPVALDVACRSTICRVQAEFASRVAADDWLTLHLLKAGREMSRVSFAGPTTRMAQPAWNCSDRRDSPAEERVW